MRVEAGQVGGADEAQRHPSAGDRADVVQGRGGGQAVVRGQALAHQGDGARVSAAGWQAAVEPRGRRRHCGQQDGEAAEKDGFLHLLSACSGPAGHGLDMPEGHGLDMAEGQGLYAASLRGAIAQLGERLNGIQEVRGLTPLGSTTIRLKLLRVSCDASAREVFWVASTSLHHHVREPA